MWLTKIFHIVDKYSFYYLIRIAKHITYSMIYEYVFARAAHIGERHI